MPGKPPRGRSLTEADKKLVRDIYKQTGSMRAASRALRIHDRTVLRILEESGVIKSRRKNETAATVPMPAKGESAPRTTKYEKAESGNGTAVIRYETTECVKTLEDAKAVADVDWTRWKVDDFIHKSWTVQMNVKTAKGHEEAVQVQQHGVTLKISQIAPKAILDGLERLYERMAAHAPQYQFAIRTPPSGVSEKCLALFCLFDVHFGKLAWAAEAHDNYDLKIAERFFENAVDDLIAKSVGRTIGRILFPLGNDFFHINSSAANTTAAGTPQDVDGRYAKIIEVGEMAFIRAVEKLRLVAPVDVTLVPGNHDTNSSYHTARVLDAMFRNCSDVSVNVSPSMRKYYAYGRSLLGFTHGSDEKHTSLPNLMAMERPREWAESTCRHWFIGHLHHAKKYQTAPVQTHEGVIIHQIRSLAGTDAWHTKKSFINLDQGAEVYYFGEKTGYDGHNVAYARLEDELKRNAG